MKPVGLLLAAMVFWAGTVSAADPVGYVKTAEGEAFLLSADCAVPAQPGLAVQSGQTLKTGRTGRLGVTFRDNTVMSLGPDTEIAIDEYLYAPGQDELKFGASLLRGTLHFISGVIAKLKPEAVSIRTPGGTIGIRGTRFLVKVEAEDTQ